MGTKFFNVMSVISLNVVFFNQLFNGGIFNLCIHTNGMSIKIICSFDTLIKIKLFLYCSFVERKGVTDVSYQTVYFLKVWHQQYKKSFYTFPLFPFSWHCLSINISDCTTGRKRYTNCTQIQIWTTTFPQSIQGHFGLLRVDLPL